MGGDFLINDTEKTEIYTLSREDALGIDIDLLDKIVEKVEGNVIDKIRQVPIQRLFPK